MMLIEKEKEFVFNDVETVSSNFNAENNFETRKRNMVKRVK